MSEENLKNIKARAFEKIKVKEQHTMKKSALRRFLATAAAACFAFLITGFTVLAATGGLEGFIQRFNPIFADVVEPVMVYSEDRGIRMTVIGARRFDAMAIIYLSLQDITGENRLTESAGFRDGFDIGMGAGDGEIIGFTNKSRLLYFDEATNSVYLEIIINTETAVSDPLTISSFLIAFEEKLYEYEPIPLSVADVSAVEMLPIIYDEHISGWTSWGMDADCVQEMHEILLPGRLMPMPHADNYWISNVGIVDGRLHVQSVLEMGEFGASNATFMLMNAAGDIVQPTIALRVWADEALSPVNLSQYLYKYGQPPLYRLTEFIFNIDTNNMANYTLVFTGRVTRGVEGNWRVAAYTLS